MAVASKLIPTALNGERPRGGAIAAFGIDRRVDTRPASVVCTSPSRVGPEAMVPSTRMIQVALLYGLRAPLVQTIPESPGAPAATTTRSPTSPAG